MLNDSFGRTHDYLRISLTERCNLRCVYCMPEEGVDLTPAKRLMSADEIVDMASEFVRLGIRKIRLTGGEPLVRKDAGDIIARLAELPVELTLTTNAVIADRFIQRFRDAGILSLNVSLDTLSEDRFHRITKRNNYGKVRENIDLLLAEGFHVKLNVVLMKGMNDDEIVNFVSWSSREPIHVRFIEFMPFDRNEWAWDRIVPYASVIKTVKESFPIEKLQDRPNDTAKAWRVINGRGTFAVISSMTEHFCGSCNRIRLTADGKLRNCLFSDEELDLLAPLRRGEPIEALIRSGIARKKERHGGIQELQKLEESPDEITRRSMILIGG